MHRYVALLVLILCGACSPGPSAAAEPFASICYVPIGAATFAPIGRENFLQQCTALGEFKVADRRFARIQKAIADASKAGNFDDNFVRVRIVMPDQRIIFIDQRGAIDAAGVVSQMGGKDLATIADILDTVEAEVGPASFARHPDQRPEARLEVAICYVPFGSATPAAISRKNFSTACTDLGKRKFTDPRFEKIFDAIKAAVPGGVFDDRAVRVRIVMPDQQVIFIDKMGVIDLGGERGVMPKKYLPELETALEGYKDEMPRPAPGD